MMSGININLVKKNISIIKKTFIVGGGLSSYLDLENLNKINSAYLEGIIAGKSFYSGAIEIKKAIKILNKNVEN